MSFKTHLHDIVHYSGRSFYHKGHYEDCLESSKLKYSLITYAYGGK